MTTGKRILAANPLRHWWAWDWPRCTPWRYVRPMRTSSIAIVAITLGGCATTEQVATTPEPKIVIAPPQRMPMKQRIARPARAVVPEGVRSPHDIQVARNVTAILRGMRHAGVERVAEAAPCETEDAGCER